MLNSSDRVLSSNTLENTIQEYKKQNKKIVFTNGCFDLLHIGHVTYLEEAKKLGDVLVVGINTDESVKKLKGPHRPIQNENDRCAILAALKSVDHTVLFGEETPIDLIKAVKPDVLVKGGDWKIEQIVGSDFVISYGGQVKSLNFVNGKSTTSIIEKSQK
jgi:D-glycero-beta-D-manno-heptose 1-phosphate adenylyltransferase